MVRFFCCPQSPSVVCHGEWVFRDKLGAWRGICHGEMDFCDNRGVWGGICHAEIGFRDNWGCAEVDLSRIAVIP